MNKQILFIISIFCLNLVSGALDCSLDFNKNSRIDSQDLSILMRYYGSSCNSDNWCSGADINKDGIVDMIDLSIMNSHLNEICINTILVYIKTLDSAGNNLDGVNVSISYYLNKYPYDDGFISGVSKNGSLILNILKDSYINYVRANKDGFVPVSFGFSRDKFNYTIIMKSTDCGENCTTFFTYYLGNSFPISNQSIKLYDKRDELISEIISGDDGVAVINLSQRQINRAYRIHVSGNNYAPADYPFVYSKYIPVGQLYGTYFLRMKATPEILNKWIGDRYFEKVQGEKCRYNLNISLDIVGSFFVEDCEIEVKYNDADSVSRDIIVENNSELTIRNSKIYSNSWRGYSFDCENIEKKMNKKQSND